MTELEDIKRAYERRVDKMRGNNDRASVDRYKQTHDALFAGMQEIALAEIPVNQNLQEIADLHRKMEGQLAQAMHVPGLVYQPRYPTWQRFVKAVSGVFKG